MAYDPRHGTDDPLLRIARHYIATLRSRRNILLSLVKRAATPTEARSDAPWVKRMDQDNAVRYVRRSVFRSAMELLAVKELMTTLVQEHDDMHSAHSSHGTSMCPGCAYTCRVAEILREIERFECR